MFDIQKGRGLMKQRKKAGILLMLVCLIITLALPVTANAAVKINKTSVSVLRGKTYNLKITGTKKKIKWTSSNKKIATVSASGKIKGINKGRCNIYAKVGKKNYTCKLTVKQPVTSIKLSKKSISLNKGKKYTLKARIAPKSAANKAVVWKSSNTKIASVSSKGVVTAKSAGTTTITATAKDGSRKKASCKVTIKNNNSKKILVTQIKFNRKETTHYIIPDYIFKYTLMAIPTSDESLLPDIYPANATNKTLLWKSSNNKVATVNSAGKVKAVGVGTAIITASAVDGSGASASYKMNVMGGAENFMVVDMTKQENIKKYLKRTNRSYDETRYTYDPWTGEKTGTKTQKIYFLYENPIYAQGWRCLNAGGDSGFENEFKIKLTDNINTAIYIGNPYSYQFQTPINNQISVLQTKGSLVFYNIRGGDVFYTERESTVNAAYRANPY